MCHVISIDIDLSHFRTELSELAKYFDLFSTSKVLGIAHEQSLHYYNTIHQYRQLHPGTQAGSLGYKVEYL